MILRCVAVLGLASALAVGCSSPPEVPLGPDGEPDPVLAQGRDIYGARCASCHGSSGDGGRGPAVTSERVTAKFPDIADEIRAVAEGRNQMPAFEDALTPQEIEAVVRYTREVL